MKIFYTNQHCILTSSGFNKKIEGELVQNVEVFNLKGQKVASYYNNQLDVSELPQGIYVVKIVGFNEYHTIRKLIKH